MTSPLLIELLTEELPPKSLQALSEAFAHNIYHGLQQVALLAETTPPYTIFATPRRLGVRIEQVLPQALSTTITHRLMPANVAWDAQHQATPALLKKLQSLGLSQLDLSAIETVQDGKQTMLTVTVQQTGAELAHALQNILSKALDNLPIAKNMRYQLADGWTTVEWVRPAHRLLVLHGAEIVPVSVLGLTADRLTEGHRFESPNPVLSIPHAENYEAILYEHGKVIAAFEARQNFIRQQLDQQAQRKGLSWHGGQALLDEVTALVETPQVLCGEFEEDFLQVPQECLILAMKTHQKYFPLMQKDNTLSHQFLFVANVSTHQADTIIHGNQRVVRARLADARFFYQQDLKKPLLEWAEITNRMTYHQKLGTQGQRIERLLKLVAFITKDRESCLPYIKQLETATRLAKADLSSYMVGEFPELQGDMGRYYAQTQGMEQTIADAIRDHYLPRFASDALPPLSVGGSNIAILISLIDRLDSLVGLMSVGEQATGDKDPFGLRRQAIAIVRLWLKLSGIIFEQDTHNPLFLKNLLAQALANYPHAPAGLYEAVYNFIVERLRVYLCEQGQNPTDKHVFERQTAWSPAAVQAVLAKLPDAWSSLMWRLQAVERFLKLPEAEALIATNKRVGNILKKATIIGVNFQTELLCEEAEKSLYQALQAYDAVCNLETNTHNKVGSMDEKMLYDLQLKNLARLKTPIDAFFDQVLVNVDDLALRHNRLALLKWLHDRLNEVADLSHLSASVSVSN